MRASMTHEKTCKSIYSIIIFINSLDETKKGITLIILYVQ